MNKKIAAVVIVAALGIIAMCCGFSNKNWLDTTFKFDRAMIAMPDGTCVELKISNWTDYGDGDQIQIKATDGKTYLVHATNCVLIKDN